MMVYNQEAYDMSSNEELKGLNTIDVMQATPSMHAVPYQDYKPSRTYNANKM